MYTLTLTADERKAFDGLAIVTTAGTSPTSCSIASQRTGSGATTTTSHSRFPSMWLGKSTNWPKKKTTLGRASHPNLSPS